MFFFQMWVKSIDLDKKHTFFFQMWVKKYRFGQKTQKIFAQFEKNLYLCGGFKQVALWKT